MGIDLASLTDRQRELMEPADRAALGIEAPSKTRLRMLRTLERDEQKTLASWLNLREADGVLVYDWSSTNRRVTCRNGMPDFKLYAGGRALLGEMKVGAAELSADQAAMVAKFARSGTEVQIWRSAMQAIEQIRNWLWKL